MRNLLLSKAAHRAETALTLALAAAAGALLILLFAKETGHYQLTITLSAAAIATGQIFDLLQYWASRPDPARKFPMMAPAIIALTAAMAGLSSGPQGWQFHAWAAFTILAMLSVIAAMLLRDKIQKHGNAGQHNPADSEG